MATTLRDAAQVLLDKLDGRRSFGVELLAAEFADERRALRAALAAPDRAQPAGDAALPVVANLSHGGELVALVEQRKHLAATDALQADLVEERNRIVDMRTEWAEEVAALTAQANGQPWFLDESLAQDDDVWLAAADAYEGAAGCLRGHLEWRDRVRAAVKVLISAVKTKESS